MIVNFSVMHDDYGSVRIMGNTPEQAATGRVWLVTGANSGFGQAIAEAALAAGDTVVAAARRPETLEALAAAHPGGWCRSGWTSPTRPGSPPWSRTPWAGTGGSTSW